MILRPKYLDEGVLYDLADNLGLESPDSRDVKRRTNRGRGASAGVRSGIEATVSGQKGEELEESFTVSRRPVQLLSAVLQELTEGESLVDLDADPGRDLPHRSAVQVSGKLSLSPASEVAELFEIFVPLLQSGTDLDSFSPAEIMQVLMDRRSVEAPAVMTLEPEAGEYRFAMILSADGLVRTESFEDLEGEFTVFGTIDRILAEDQQISLERFMLPGLNRTLRRAIGEGGIAEMLQGLAQTTGRTFALDDLAFHGPGGLISVAAIYP